MLFGLLALGNVPENSHHHLLLTDFNYPPAHFGGENATILAQDAKLHGIRTLAAGHFGKILPDEGHVLGGVNVPNGKLMYFFRAISEHFTHTWIGHGEAVTGYIHQHDAIDRSLEQCTEPDRKSTRLNSS